jgi:alpha-galactosidase
MKRIWLVIPLTLIACCDRRTRALEPTREELQYARQVVAAAFDVPGGETAAVPSIEVLRQDHTRLQRRRSVLLTPLRVGGVDFQRGLGTHATSHLRVHLPAGADRFVAKVGIDDNYNTGGRRGSVVFSVHAGDTELFTSPILRGPDPPLDAEVPVSARTTRALHVANAGDGDSHDQCDWADAAIVTDQGERIWLDALPIRDLTWLADDLPFSFRYDGRDGRELLALCGTGGELDHSVPGPTQVTLAYHHKDTGLHVTWQVVLYDDLPAAEWVLYFENTAQADTPLLEDVRALDFTLRRAGGPRESFVLHAARGGICTPEDFEPLRIPLRSGHAESLGTSGGRSSNQHLPFFNVDAVGRGMVAAVGWSGQWKADFQADAKGFLRVRAGMETTRLRLRPGERIRSPRILVVFWEGDRLRGHNFLRRLIYRHKTPLVVGHKPLPGVQCNTWFPVGDNGNLANAQNQIGLLQAYAPLGIEYMVMDAGWFEGLWPMGVGNWTVRPDAFPDGLEPVGQAAKRAGIKFGMWFEPERVCEGTLLDREHPDWLLRLDGNPTKLLNLGHPKAEQWFVETVSRYVDEVPLGYFRHDCNINPLPYWQAADEPDRAGITEIRYVEALYRIWDELHRRYPDLLIEGCASGGRRIDLESVSRSHTYWKSDLYGDFVANQGHVYGASLYLPGNYLNTPISDLSKDPYAFRSQLGGALCLAWDPRRKGFDRKRAVERIEQFKALRHLFVGDFYPLMDHSVDPMHWTGYQFHRDDLGEGVALLFRRDRSPYPAVQIRLRGLEAGMTYELQDVDTSECRTLTGRELAEPLEIEIEKAPGSVLIVYRTP